MITAHALEGFFLYLVFEVAVLFITIFLQALFLFLILFIEVDYDFARLLVFHLVDMIDLFKEGFFTETTYSIIDHIHGELNFEGEILVQMGLAQCVEHIVNSKQQFVLVDQACHKNCRSLLEVMVS